MSRPGPAQQTPHVVLGGEYYLLDESAEVTFRPVFDSLMQPRTDVSGVPGAINLQRDVWLWALSDFVGGEGREVFDSGDPLRPPVFWKTDGGIDVRIQGEFSLHPDEQLITNETGGGSAPVRTVWSNGASGGDFTTVSGSPDYGVGPNSNHLRLNPGDKVRAPARTPGTDVVRVYARFVQARTTRQNKKVSVRFEVWNNTDSVVTSGSTQLIGENEPITIIRNFTAVAGKTYHYRVSNEEGSGSNTVQCRSITEERFGTGPASSQEVQALRLGINDNVWALTWDGSSTDVLRWNFSSNTWDQIVANMNSGQPRSLTGSDQYMYALLDNGRIYRINDSAATYYAEPPTTSGVGEPLGLAVANNRLYALYSQALFELTLDSTDAGLPFTEAEADYAIVISPGEMPKEMDPDTTLRGHISAIPNGVRWFVNIRGGQSVIYEYSDAAAAPKWHLPRGFIATCIHHYANITFIGGVYINSASDPSDIKAGVYYIGSDQLLRFSGIPRFNETDADSTMDTMSIRAMDSYHHDLYMLQKNRIWRYNLGTGGATMDNAIDLLDNSSGRDLAHMDKKFWVASSNGTFVADDSFPTQTMWLYSPVWDYDLPDLQKLLLSFDLVLRPLPSETRVDIEYRTDESDTWVSLDGELETMALTVDDTVKKRFTVSTGESTVKFTTLQWRCGLTSLDGVDTPRIRSVTARAYVLEYERWFDMTLRMDDDSSTDRPRTSQRRGRQKMQRLLELVTTKELTTFEDHYSSDKFRDSDTYTVVLEDPFGDLFSRGQGSVRLKAKVIE